MQANRTVCLHRL